MASDIPSLPPAEMNQLAIDFAAGKVFADVHCPEDMFRLVFLAFTLMEPAEVQKLVDDGIGMVYEYIDKAGSLSINGLPTFFSAKYINKADKKLLFQKVKVILDAQKKALEDMDQNASTEGIDGKV